MADPIRKRGEKLIEYLAQRIDHWHLVTPAILLLEVAKPLSFVASQGLLLCEPVLGFFFDESQIADYADLLADRTNLERLIARLTAGQVRPDCGDGVERVG